MNADSPYDIFGPTALAGKGKWIQAMRGNGCFLILRLYSPLELFPESGRPHPGSYRELIGLVAS